MDHTLGRHHVAAVRDGWIGCAGQELVIAAVVDVATESLDSHWPGQPALCIAVEVDECDATGKAEILLGRQDVIQDVVRHTVTDGLRELVLPNEWVGVAVVYRVEPVDARTCAESPQTMAVRTH